MCYQYVPLYVLSICTSICAINMYLNMCYEYVPLYVLSIWNLNMCYQYVPLYVLSICTSICACIFSWIRAFTFVDFLFFRVALIEVVLVAAATFIGAIVVRWWVLTLRSRVPLALLVVIIAPFPAVAGRGVLWLGRGRFSIGWWPFILLVAKLDLLFQFFEWIIIVLCGAKCCDLLLRVLECHCIGGSSLRCNATLKWSFPIVVLLAVFTERQI